MWPQKHMIKLAAMVFALGLWVAKCRARAVPHLDFGTRWTDPTAPDCYHRVSWIPTTGELYVTDLAGSHVRFLAIVPTKAEVDAILTDWGTVGAQADAPLSWVEDRLAQWAGSTG